MSRVSDKPMSPVEDPSASWIRVRPSGFQFTKKRRFMINRDLIIAISGCMKVRMRAAEPRTGWGFSMMKLWKTMIYKGITTKPFSLRYSTVQYCQYPIPSHQTWSYGHPPSSIATRTTPAIVAAQTITINSRCHWEANNFAKMVHMKLLTMVMGSSKNPFVISFSPGTIVPYHSMNLISKCLWNT